jgi:hypothetical protein
MKHRLPRFLLALALATGALAASTAARVDATEVSGEAAFRAAWANPAETRVDLTADVTLTCTTTSGDGIAVRDSTTAITVDGHGFTVNQTCRTGGNNGVLWQRGTGAVVLTGVVIAGGDVVGNMVDPITSGGVTAAGALTVVGSTVFDNAVYQPIELAMTKSGGLSSAGTLTIVDSAIRGNSTHKVGGAATGGGAFGYAVTVRNSTISGNEADAAGGVAGSNGMTVISSTISGNTANGIGGAGGGVLGSSVSLVYATVAGNVSAFAANIYSPYPESFASVIALPSGGGDNCDAGATPGGAVAMVSHGFNLEDDADGSCGFASNTDDVAPGTPAALAELADNGGSTLTRAPQLNSALVDAIPLGSCQLNGAAGITADQRGRSRPAGSGCDVGAVEVQPPAGGYVPLTPARLLDTRVAGQGPCVAGGSPRQLTVTGVGGVPPTGVGAVAVNVAVADPTNAGYLTVWPTGVSQPVTSNMNFATGQTISNTVLAKVGANGQISIANAIGCAQVIIDVQGWYAAP